MIEIVVTRRADDYHACIGNDERLWGCGKNIDEAVGSAIRSHAERAGLVIHVDEKPFSYYKHVFRAITAPIFQGLKRIAK